MWILGAKGFKITPAKMDRPVGAMDANPESQKGTSATTNPPEICSAPQPRPFLCPQCPKTYRLQKHLDVHRKVHSADKPHVCPLCNKAWAYDSQLTLHLRTHTGERLFKCSADGCGKEFAQGRTLRFHMKTHNGEKMEPKPTCAICERSFANPGRLKIHNRKLHNPEKNPCVTCGKVCVSLKELKRHLETHLPDDPQNCPICGTSCRNGLTLKKHVQKHGQIDRVGRYHCEQCAKDFKTNKYLNSHISTVHYGRSYNKNRNRNHECSLCGLKWSSPSDLAIHLRTHTGEKPFKCTSCPKAFPSNDKLRAHLKVHTGEKLEICQFCGQRFAWQTSLNRHIRSHTGETPHKCVCGRAFRDNATLKRHRLAIHPEELPVKDVQISTHTQVEVNVEDPLHIPSDNKQGLNNHCTANSVLHVGPTDANLESQESETSVTFHPPGMGAAPEPRPFPCPHCPNAYCLKQHLNNHIKVHCPDNLHVCPLCDKVWTDSYKLTRHMRSHTGEKLFKCPTLGCGKEFVHRYTLESHIGIHTGEKIEPKPTCAICGTSFAHIHSLNAHNSKFHNPQAKQHPCVTCGKVFPVSTELKRHLETHLPDDPQECTICGKSCRNGLALKEHMQRHIRQGNHNCEHCLKNFTTKILLRKHIRTVHDGQKDTRNKNHVCSFCGWKFSSSSDLTVHLRTHTGEKPFQCTICSKAFPTMKRLQSHSKLHTGENLEECQFCGRKFTLSANLTQHLRTHTGETPYKCDVCGKAFRWGSSLDGHKTAAHSGEQQREASTHADADDLVPTDPMRHPNQEFSKERPLSRSSGIQQSIILGQGIRFATAQHSSS